MVGTGACYFLRSMLSLVAHLTHHDASNSRSFLQSTHSPAHHSVVSRIPTDLFASIYIKSEAENKLDIMYYIIINSRETF
jgi:hypothetical protein